MSRFEHKLTGDRFLVTSELNPPKGVDVQPLLERARVLDGWVDAINVTDCAGARMAMAPVAACSLLANAGVEPILQLTSRDRNRLALQADILAASALGVVNLVVMGGDPPSNGDHPEAKPVFDLFASQVIAAASALAQGTDMAGNPLNGTPRLCIGAVVNPGASDLPDELKRMREKVDAGATFLQTQAIYDIDVMRRFLDRLGDPPVPLLAGVIPLKSVNMAQFLNDKVPGVSVPESLMKELGDSADTRATAIDMSARIVAGLQGLCRGVHIMAIGWEETIPELLSRAGVSRRD